MKANPLGIVLMAAGCFWFLVAVLMFVGFPFSSAFRIVLLGLICLGGLAAIAGGLVDPKEPHE